MLVHYFLGQIYMLVQRHHDAIAEYRRALEVEPANTLNLAGLGQALAAGGDRDGTREILAQLEETSRSNYVGWRAFAMPYSALDELERALDYLEKAYGEHEPTLVWMKYYPVADALSEHPRFAEIIARM